jgi:hypothetical protein
MDTLETYQRVVELVKRGAHAASGVLILGHIIEEDEARPLQGLGDLDGGMT